MPSINEAYQWAVNTCNAPNVGYSQDYRYQQTVNGITYYDCSSFIWYALQNGGFPVADYGGGIAFTTRTMQSILLELGFTETVATMVDPWLPGDIVWRTGHTEMVYSGYTTMGAHYPGIPLQDQVSINKNPADPSSWATLFRYGTGGATVLEWIFGNFYLDESQMQNNAYIIYSRYYNTWTLNAISGLLGNMETESTINPGLWQDLDEGNTNKGFGLVQWTPSTNYTGWATANGYQIDDGNGQLVWIDTLSESSGQWIPTSDYNMTWEQFKVSTDSPENLASAFLKNFERAGVEKEQERRENARKWYNYLFGKQPGGDGTSKIRRGLPVWAMIFP